MSCCYKKRGSTGGMVYVYCGGRGNLCAAKTPPLQSALRGDRWGGLPYRPSFTPRRHLRELRRRITTWHAASLQTPPAPTMPMRTSTETAWRPENDASRRVATVGMARRVLRCMRPRPSFTLRQASMGRRGGGSRRGTLRRYALRRTGRIGFKPRYSKGELWRKACMGFILYWLWGPSPSCG